MKNKEFLETNLSRFRVWEYFQMIYLLFIFSLSVIYWILFLGLVNWA
jgi:hypothetical protein